MEYPLYALKDPINRTHSKKGEIVSHNLKAFKGVVVVVIAVGFGMLLIDKIYVDSDNGIMIGNNLELSWDVPTENVDNSPLSNLAGYTIHCWNSEDQQTATIVIADSQNGWARCALPLAMIECQWMNIVWIEACLAHRDANQARIEDSIRMDD